MAKIAFQNKWEMEKRHAQMCTLDKFLEYRKKLCTGGSLFTLLVES